MDLEKKIIIADSEIPKCPEFEAKLKIGKLFKKHNPLEEYSVSKVDKDGRKYILFRIDVYFCEFLLAVEIDEKGHTDRDLIFEEKRQEVLEKKLVVNLLELIQVMQ